MASPNAAFRQRHNQAAMPSSTSSTSSTSSSASHHGPTSETTSATGSGSTASGGGGGLLRPAMDDQEEAADSSRRGSAVEEGPATAAPRLLRRSDTVGQIALMLSDDYIGESKPLLLAVPVSILVACIPHVPDTLVFVLNAVALVPLAALNILTVLTMTRNARVWGGLLRAVGGNSTEFVLSAVALTYGESALVQQTMIGIIINYSLLVLGGSFLHASYGKKDAAFSKSRTGIMSSLVMVTSFCLVIPTIMSLTTQSEGIDSPDALRRGILNLSHITAMALVLLFFTYLSFRFVTHGQFFPVNPGAVQFNPDSRTNTRLDPKQQQPQAPAGPLALGLGLLGSLVCTTLCAGFLLRSMNSAAATMQLTKTFIAFVVLPLIVSSAKSISIVRHARPEDSASTQMSRLDFAIRSVMTNVLDALLFNIPLLVFLGWALNQPLVLVFGLFDAVVFLLSVTIMTFLVRYGKTTYFESCMLMGTYLSMAIVSFVRPEVQATVAPAHEFIRTSPPQASLL